VSLSSAVVERVADAWASAVVATDLLAAAPRASAAPLVADGGVSDLPQPVASNGSNSNGSSLRSRGTCDMDGTSLAKPRKWNTEHPPKLIAPIVGSVKPPTVTVLPRRRRGPPHEGISYPEPAIRESSVNW
jgi:hypothetical protein